MPKVMACLEKDLPPGTKTNINLMGRTVLLANVNGEILAVDGICYSDGGNLADGVLNGYTIRCPIHGSEYDLRTGEVIKGPWSGSSVKTPLRTYPVSLEEGCVNIDLS